jgi:hypothetical protein
VARQVEDRDTGKDARFAMRLRLFDKQGRVRERAMRLISRRGAAGDPAKGDQVLVRFDYPNDIKGTSFLVWEHPASEDERFLYLPALGRVRRIAGSEAQESFVGTDFTYEDIGGREFDDYTYSFADERATWTDPAGKAHPAWRLESKVRQGDPLYPRVVSLVTRDTFLVVHADIFNRRDEREKVYDVKRLSQVKGIWTVMESAVANERTKTRTELEVTAADYNVGLTDDQFSRRALEKGADTSLQKP